MNAYVIKELLGFLIITIAGACIGTFGIYHFFLGGV